MTEKGDRVSKLMCKVTVVQVARNLQRMLQGKMKISWGVKYAKVVESGTTCSIVKKKLGSKGPKGPRSEVDNLHNV